MNTAPPPNKDDIELGIKRLKYYMIKHQPHIDNELAVLLAQQRLLLSKLKDIIK